MEKRIKVRVKNGIHRTAVQSVKLMISLNHQLDKTCLEDPLYKLSSSQMLNKIMLYLILTMHHFSDGFPFLPHYLEKDIMKNEHQRDHKMLLGYKIQSQKPEMEVALYLCFTKTREILGNGKSIPDAREISRGRGFCTSGIPAGPTSCGPPSWTIMFRQFELHLEQFHSSLSTGWNLSQSTTTPRASCSTQCRKQKLCCERK